MQVKELIAELASMSDLELEIQVGIPVPDLADPEGSTSHFEYRLIDSVWEDTEDLQDRLVQIWLKK
jgi:hypothetical protein